jgi:hypothetical protein
VTSLSQHSPKNKTTRQLDLFADEAPPEHGVTQIGNRFRFGVSDVAPAGTAPAHDPLAGLAVKLEHDRCKCGSDTAIIGAGKAMHRASLTCRSCGRHRGWLSKFTADWIESVISLHGKPDKPIVMRGPQL